jgi:hypothetical protein
MVRAPRVHPASTGGDDTTADRALRLMVLVRRPVQDYDLDALAGLSASTSPMPLLSLRATPKGWERAAA